MSSELLSAARYPLFLHAADEQVTETGMSRNGPPEPQMSDNEQNCIKKRAPFSRVPAAAVARASSSSEGQSLARLGPIDSPIDRGVSARSTLGTSP